MAGFNPQNAIFHKSAIITAEMIHHWRNRPWGEWVKLNLTKEAGDWLDDKDYNIVREEQMYYIELTDDYHALEFQLRFGND